jgi:hypothetical protein
VRQLKEIVFYDLEKLLSTRYHKGTLLPRLSCSEVIVPLLTLLDNLLVVGALRDQRDLGKLLSLLDPQTFALKGTPYCEGLLSLQVAVEEPIKLALCSVLQHLCDCLVQHRVESTVAFAATYVDSLRRDQKERYEKTFAKKPREFRSPPKKQRWRGCCRSNWAVCPAQSVQPHQTCDRPCRSSTLTSRDTVVQPTPPPSPPTTWLIRL